MITYTIALPDKDPDPCPHTVVARSKRLLEEDNNKTFMEEGICVVCGEKRLFKIKIDVPEELLPYMEVGIVFKYGLLPAHAQRQIKRRQEWLERHVLSAK